MKRSTIILIATVFIASVFVVGVFGLKSVPYNEIVYVQKITPTAVTLSDGSTAKIYKDAENENEYYVRVTYSEGLIVVVDYEITPNDATNRRLHVSIENFDVEPAAELTDIGVKFLRKGTVKLTYSATDSGSPPTMVFYIYTK